MTDKSPRLAILIEPTAYGTYLVTAMMRCSNFSLAVLVMPEPGAVVFGDLDIDEVRNLKSIPVTVIESGVAVSDCGIPGRAVGRLKEAMLADE
jgi:hypothetical protein